MKDQHRHKCPVCKDVYTCGDDHLPSIDDNPSLRTCDSCRYQDAIACHKTVAELYGSD